MTVMILTCPHCNSRFNVPDEAIGRTGRCPKCKEPALITAGGAIAPQSVASSMRAATPIAAGASPLGGQFAPGGHLELSDGPPARVPDVDEGAYDLADGDGDDASSPLPALPRAGASDERPRMSKQEREEELADIRSEGNGFLWKLRLQYFGLAVFIIAVNVYYYSTIDEIVNTIKSELILASADPAQVEELARLLGTFFRFECVLFFLLGLGLGATAVVLRWYPRIASIAAFGTFVAVQAIDFLAIYFVFGPIAMGQMLFTFATLIKIAIISALWHGIQVGAAYQEQVVDPERELARQADDE